MRAFKAARRSAERRPIPFLYEWEERVDVRDEETGEITGTEYEPRQRLFECRGEVSSLLLSDLAYNSELEVTDPAGVALLRQFFAQAFGDDEQYREFFNIHIRYGDDDLLMEILQGLVEDFMARPTKSLSPSSTGQQTTGEVSKVVSLSRGSVQVVEGDVIEDMLTGPEAAAEESQASSSA